jgi:hypothetical protein
LLATITALPRHAFIEPTGTHVRTEQFRASAKSPKREQVGNSGFIEAPCSCPIRGHLRRKITSAPQIQAEHFNARILLTFRATETVPKNCVAHSLNLSLCNNADTACRNDEIVNHKPVDRVWITSLPDRGPKIFNDLD